MRTKLRNHPYLTRHLTHRITAHCAATGITISAFFQGASPSRSTRPSLQQSVSARAYWSGEPGSSGTFPERSPFAGMSRRGD